MLCEEEPQLSYDFVNKVITSWKDLNVNSESYSSILFWTNSFIKNFW